MTNDLFSGFHPAANVVFFAAAIALGVVIQHPAYTVAGVAGSLLYLILLRGSFIRKILRYVVTVFLLISLLNPLFNIYGETSLFHILNRPYTLEALCYGLVIAGMFTLMIFWFCCITAVVTGDRFISVFGRMIPSLSLMLVMVLRMIPDLLRKMTQISGTRRSIGKAASETASLREKAESGMTVLSALADQALEGSVVTADSMRARGYGSAKRTSFQIYRFTRRDLILIAVTLALTAAVIASGDKTAVFTPSVELAPLNWGLIVYCVLVALPSVLHIKEALTWRILRSGI
ncbi:MAG: energy-coupling factor transporter transmembrane protein EcfT [Lachnospiraceae bacterium]|nr:energy-coupling factor transporter transmembrane protein EcfT [Lachnospiraceae bacterium]